LPAIRPWRQFSEPFRRSLYQQHHAGIDAAGLARREQLGQATVERCYAQFTERKARERISRQCPLWLGIDEHSIHRGHRFATTFCDLRNHRVFDVVPGRSVAELEDYVRQLHGRERVELICIDLSSPYRALIKRFFPNARIVADRFHVVRLVYQHFLELIRSIAPQVARHRGLLACLRRPRQRLKPHQLHRLRNLISTHPALGPILDLREQLCALLNLKTQTARQCRGHARELLRLIAQLNASSMPALITLANTLSDWAQPIAVMWRFVKNNGITEGFHRKMKLIQRRAYGFRNFHNYRLRVIAQCG
jgi:transposase